MHVSLVRPHLWAHPYWLYMITFQFLLCCLLFFSLLIDIKEYWLLTKTEDLEKASVAMLSSCSKDHFMMSF